ncbi:hypothetical protein EJB05_24841, partial [Eragrostis curvula]
MEVAAVAPEETAADTERYFACCSWSSAASASASPERSGGWIRRRRSQAGGPAPWTASRWGRTGERSGWLGHGSGGVSSSASGRRARRDDEKAAGSASSAWMASRRAAFEVYLMVWSVRRTSCEAPSGTPVRKEYLTASRQE